MYAWFLYMYPCASHSLQLYRQPSPTLKPFPSQSRDRSETEMGDEDGRAERMNPGQLNHRSVEQLSKSKQQMNEQREFERLWLA